MHSPLSELEVGSSPIRLRRVQEDGHIGWTSPVDVDFVTAQPRAGASGPVSDGYYAYDSMTGRTTCDGYRLSW